MVSFQDISSCLSGLRKPLAAVPEVRLVIRRDGATEEPRALGIGDYRIGTRTDCDIVLPEAPAAQFGVLKVSMDNGALSLAIVPFAAGLTHRGLAAAPFVPLHLGASADVTIGAATLAFGSTPAKASTTASVAALAKARADLADAPPAVSRLRSLDPRTMLLAAGVLFGAAFISSMLDSGLGPFTASDPSPQPAAGDRKVADAGDMMTLIRQQLSAADLGDSLRASFDGKTILIDGAVSDRQEDRYRMLLAGFRRRSPVEIRSQVQPVASPLQTQIAGVALSPVALVVMQDGGRFRVGDTMPKGWRIDAITDQGVTLSRDAMRVTVPLGGR